MRPRKRVLLYCADAVAGEQMRWMLEVRSLTLRVTAVASPEAFATAASLEDVTWDCVVVYRSELGARPMVGNSVGADRQVCELLRAAKGDVVVVELANGMAATGFSCFHKLVPGALPLAMADVVNAVTLACIRKRGPRTEKDIRRGLSLAAAGMVA